MRALGIKIISRPLYDLLSLEELKFLGGSERPRARLITPLVFEIDGKMCVIPAGFVTDFASIPKLLQSIWSPIDPRYILSAIIHDYAYQFGGVFPLLDGGFLWLEPRRNRGAVDGLFIECMEVEGAGPITRQSIYRGVRIGGWVAWGRYRKVEKLMTERIKKIQIIVGVEPDGKAGPLTWAAIARRLGVEDPGAGLTAQIRAVQSVLCIAIDGIVGNQTWGAVEAVIQTKTQDVVVRSARPDTISCGGTNSARLLAHARKDIGLKEVPGAGSNPRIKAAILQAATWLDPDDSKTAWCGCIMGLWCNELGLPTPSEHFRAANWLNIGQPVDLADAQPGDIVVISRTGGNHVALFVDFGLTLLGGNQANAVNVASFDRSSLRGIRRL